MVRASSRPRLAADARLQLISESRREDPSGGGVTRRFWSGPAASTIVAQARRAVMEFAVDRVSSARLIDISLCVSEAVSNAVVHAFEDGRAQRTITISAAVGPDALTVVITDDGTGFQVRSDNAGRGLGLRLIATLSDSLSVARASLGGTEVSISFDLDQESPQRATSGCNAGAART